ncbi:MAG TPA: sugar ABC transporter permease [Chloroflexota bacterium]|nr:sugar ABC transporter permease [Chloroflexota bacterium]
MSARPGSLARREAVAGYLFIAPAVLGFLLWTAGPMLASIWLATTDWDLIRAPRPVGLANVQHLLEDDLFWTALVATAYYTVVHVPLALALAFAIALLLNVHVRAIGFFRTVYYLPSIVPAVANAVLWVWIFNSEFGLLNLGLETLGLPKVAWLQDPSWAMPALILMSLWSLGATMVIYLAGLQGVPQHLYEAAAIDGAGALPRFWHVTVPMLSPIIFFNLVMQIIGSFQVFTAGYIMTRGGPQNATLFYVLYLFQNAFQYFKMGYASAMAWVLFLIVLGFSLLVFRYVGRLVHYEESR